MENGSAWAEGMPTFLLELYDQVLPGQGETATGARQRYHQILSRVEREEPPPAVPIGRGHPQGTPGRNPLRWMTEHEDAVLAFARVEGVPFINNQVE